MAFCGFLRESPQITHPSLSRDLCRDRFLPQTWTLNSGFVLLLLRIFPGAAMPRCCEATVLIKRVGISTHTHRSCVSPTQSDLRWDQSSDELQVGTGKIRSLDGDRSGAGWQGGLASISVPPPHPSLRSEVTSSSPLCSQAENCPFWRWAASAPWHRAQNAAVHRLLHPSAAQRYLRPPAVDLTLLLLPPRCCCSPLWSQ